MADFPFLRQGLPWGKQVIDLINNALSQLAGSVGGGGLSDGDYGDITVSGTGTVLTVDNNVVTNAKAADMATQTFKGRTTAGTGDPEDLTVAQAKSLLNLSGTNSGDQTITLTSDVTGSGTGSFATTIANNAVTYAKMQDVSATSRIIGRKTSGSGDPEECTLSEILDFIGSAAQGDILYRGAASWARLGAGTSGQVLKTQGAGANPIWGTVPGGSGGALVLLEAHTASNSASLDFTTGFSATYDDYELHLVDIVPATDGADLWTRVSTDGGATWKSGASDYQYSSIANASNTGTVAGASSTGAAQMLITANLGNASGRGGCGRIVINNPNGSLRKMQNWNTVHINNAGNSVNRNGSGAYISTTATNGIQILMSSGNISSGAAYLYGVAKA